MAHTHRQTERVSISNIIMQGTVFGSLICTSVVDKLAKTFYGDSKLLYKYKGEVDVPILGMVDDVLNVATCTEQAVLSNCTINSFIEHNKLKLASTKCSRVHVGKKVDNCYDLKVHEDKMKDSNTEKYLGDYISHDGKHDNTHKDRTLRAYSYLSEIRALLSDMPFGKRRLQIGLMLRDAMFINGVLFNSEAWHSVQLKHLEELEVIDRSLLRFIIGSHSKTPSEMLYLETSTIPLRYVISIRRMLYFHTLVTRSEDELTHKIYKAQKSNPVKGDWVHHLKEDFELIGEEINENLARDTSRKDFKDIVKSKIREKVFNILKETQETHTKVKHITYNTFKLQDYMKSHMLTNHEVASLFSLRCRTYKSIQNNFGKKSNCSLGCPALENQEHWIICDKTRGNLNTDIEYTHLFGTLTQQINIVKLFSLLEEERKELAHQMAAPSLPVAGFTGPRPSPGS